MPEQTFTAAQIEATMLEMLAEAVVARQAGDNRKAHGIDTAAAKLYDLLNAK